MKHFQDIGHQITKENDPWQKGHRWGEPKSCPSLPGKAQGGGTRAESNWFPEPRRQNWESGRPGKLELSGRAPRRREPQRGPQRSAEGPHRAEYWPACVHEETTWGWRKNHSRFRENSLHSSQRVRKSACSLQSDCKKTIIPGYSGESCLNSEE